MIPCRTEKYFYYNGKRHEQYSVVHIDHPEKANDYDVVFFIDAVTADNHKMITVYRKGEDGKKGTYETMSYDVFISKIHRVMSPTTPAMIGLNDPEYYAADSARLNLYIKLIALGIFVLIVILLSIFVTARCLYVFILVAAGWVAWQIFKWLFSK